MRENAAHTIHIQFAEAEHFRFAFHFQSGGANGIGRRVVAIHQKGKDVSADCTYEYGTVATMLGQAADQLDVW